MYFISKTIVMPKRIYEDDRLSRDEKILLTSSVLALDDTNRSKLLTYKKDKGYRMFDYDQLRTAKAMALLLSKKLITISDNGSRISVIPNANMINLFFGEELVDEEEVEQCLAEIKRKRLNMAKATLKNSIWTNEELAEMLGVKTPTVSDFVNALEDFFEDDTEENK